MKTKCKFGAIRSVKIKKGRKMKYIIYILVFAVIASVLLLAKSLIAHGYKKNKNSVRYKKKFILTKNEYSFFYKLKPIAEKHNLSILCKIRLADLIEPLPSTDKSEWYSAFNRIKSKHIDFVLTTQNLNVLLLIELEDSSHEKADRIERDNFVKAAIESAGLKLLCVYNNNDSVSVIEKYLNNYE